MARIVTLLSDFGSSSPYPAAMKAVLARTGATLIDISHEVPRHDVRTGAFLLYSAAPNFPVGTVHLAVIDPGVGTARRPLIVGAGGQTFVGPDNGLLMPAARRLGPPTVHEITDPAILHEGISNTFHGRDVFAAAAALLVTGVPPAVIGSPIMDHVALDFGSGRRVNDTLVGQVIYVDAFGNLVTNLAMELMDGLMNPVIIQIGRRRGTARLASAYGSVAVGRVAVVPGSDGLIEVAVREGHAARRFAGAVGASVRITAKVTRP